VFWTCTGNSVENPGMFQLLLRSAYTESRPFLFLRLPQRRAGWGCTRSWEGTQPGQLIAPDQRVIPCHMTSCSAMKLGGKSVGGLLLRSWLGIGPSIRGEQLVFFISIICLSWFLFLFCYFPFHYYYY